MSTLRLIFDSLVFHRRMHAAVALGVIAATAVLTGALGVGDSMRGSLRQLTLDRLGRIDHVLVTDRFFRVALADELAAQPEFASHFAQAVPAILMAVSVENPDLRANHRISQVNLVGCDERFWQLEDSPKNVEFERVRIVLNEPLAEWLGVKVGERVMLRLPHTTTVPAESPLGRKTDAVQGYSLEIGAIVPAQGLGRFSLRPNQQVPMNAYVPLKWLANRPLKKPDRANAILVAGRDTEAASPPESDAVLARLLRPKLSDYGIRVEQTPRGYVNITSERLILDEATEQEIVRKVRETRPESVQPALTYLANTIAVGDREIPYSTVTAIDFAESAPLGPMVAADGKPIPPLADDQIVLNAWAAGELQAKPGDTVRLAWFEPETQDGLAHEQSGEFRLAAIAAMEGAAADPALTPEVPGVTDQTSMAQWDPPFPFDASRIRQQDEDYWKEHRATPKAFVSLATGRKLWQSRFGRTTSLRVVPKEGETAAELERQLALDPASQGFVFQPVKRQGLEAAAGTTPFDVLFLLFSMFLILAAVMLVALLFRLGVERRSGEIGTLLALGFPQRRVGRLLAAEGLVVAGVGSLLGVLAGVGYTALLVVGLRTWWLAAVGTPFLQLHVSPLSLAIGYLSGLVVAVVTIAWTVRRALRTSAARLMAGRGAAEPPGSRRSSRLATATSVAALLGALAIGRGRTGGSLLRRRSPGLGGLVDVDHQPAPRRGDRIGGRCRVGQPRAAGNSQRGTPSRTQHAEHRAGGRGLFPDRLGQRFPDRSDRAGSPLQQRRRRVCPGGRKCRAHPPGPEYGGRPR
jgi:ABC-type lipoprotein release transport system permease subunit